MAMSDKTRKLLWGRSGNLCAMCHEVLSREKTEHDSHAIIGEEAHVFSKSENGPRYRPDLNIDFDAYDNLVLLCGNHHSLIDTQEIEYHADFLFGLKKKHEKWVKDSLLKAHTSEQIDEYEKTRDETDLLLLPQIKDGKDIMQIALNSMALDADYEPTESEGEVAAISDYLQNLKDWADILSEVEIGERVKITLSMGSDIQQLESNGFFLFGRLHNKKYRGARNNIITMSVAMIRILKKENESIISNGEIKGVLTIAPNWITGFTY